MAVTVPFPVERARQDVDEEELARLRGVEPGQDELRTLPVWVLAVLVVVVAAVACLAAYLLLRP